VGERASLAETLPDVSRAVAHIKRNAAEYNVDPNRIFVLGFSAGGHLAASIGTLHDRDIAAFEGMEKGENRPAGMVVCYGASTLGKYSHELSRLFVYGKTELSEEEIARYSPDKNVSQSTVPAFIWHTATDEVVDVGNALTLADALIDGGIPTELHIYPVGYHGLSVLLDGTAPAGEYTHHAHISSWVGDCAQWIKTVK